MTRDRALIAQVIEREMKKHPDIRGKKSRLAHRADITRTTLDSALDPTKWDRTSSGTFSAIEIGLDLPVDTLAFIGLHDWGGLLAEGVGQDLIDWAQRKANPSNPHIQEAGNGEAV